MFRPVWGDAFQVCFSLSSLYSARRMHPYQNMLHSAPSVIVCYYYNAPQKLSLCTVSSDLALKKQKKKEDMKLTREKKERQTLTCSSAPPEAKKSPFLEKAVAVTGP